MEPFIDVQNFTDAETVDDINPVPQRGACQL